MAFTPTTWVDGNSPYITAVQLNRMEAGIDDAHAGLIDDGVLTLAKLADLAALSVPGRASATSGVMAAITAGTDGHVLRRSGNVIGFSQIGTLSIADEVVTDAKLQHRAALSVMGRSANSTGDPADITAGTDGYVLRRSGTTLAFGQVVEAGIANGAVTVNKIGNEAVNSFKTTFWKAGSSTGICVFSMASDGTINGAPSGWSTTKDGTGDYTLTYTGSFLPTVFWQAEGSLDARIVTNNGSNTTAKELYFQTFDASGTKVDTALRAIAIYALA